jgi:type IV pilus assembly protein PilO
MEFDIKKINVDMVTKLPLTQKLIGLATLIVIIIGLYIYLGWLPQSKKLSDIKGQLSSLQEELARKKVIRSNLERFKEEVTKMNKRLEEAKTQLPNKSEIPLLLVDITNIGKESGLEFTLFEPKPEVKKDFYAEVPVMIALSGGYHDIAVYFNKMSELPRIVNVSNLDLGNAKPVGDKTIINASFMLTTFRFLEGDKK